MSNDVLTVAQTAQYLQVCKKTARRLISKGDLFASKVRSSWRIPKKDVDFCLETNRNSIKGGK